MPISSTHFSLEFGSYSHPPDFRLSTCSSCVLPQVCAEANALFMTLKVRLSHLFTVTMHIFCLLFLFQSRVCTLKEKKSPCFSSAHELLEAHNEIFVILICTKSGYKRLLHRYRMLFLMVTDF